MRLGYFLLSSFLIAATVASAQTLPNSPGAQQAAQQKINTDTGWPRTFKDATHELVIYQPQVEKWDGNRIYLYSALELKNANEKPNYGVVWFNGRTEVDKVNRLVTISDAAITKLQFPAARNQESKINALLASKLPGKTKIISLDRLEACVKTIAPEFPSVEVKNDPPRIIFSTKPALLVTIDGEPKQVPVQSTSLKRIVNTSAGLLFEPENKKYYLRVKDWWLESSKLDGPWVRADKLTKDMKRAEEYLLTQTKAQVESEAASKDSAAKDGKPPPKEDDKKAPVPAVYVVYAPTELIETDGEPQFESIPGLSLEYVKNTNATILRSGQNIFILISGRWFRSNSLQGEWAYIPKQQIPAEFAKIPVNSPMAKVLASVPGTPQSDEALIANSIPQTATITRSEAKLTVVYDGEPAFVPIEGTSMQYARNTSVPVIRVGDNKYYSVEAGVWFVAASPQGPWKVTATVPEEIYTIPPSSPLHYVTYAKVYGSTPEVVYVGYTPGYYGTVVSSQTTTVVYGTGWYYPPYVSSTVWYGYPYSYGVGAGFTWTNSAGWSFGFGYGYSYYPYYPWWGPMGYYGYGWYPYSGWGAWGGAASANVYGRWGNTAYSRTGAAWANPYTGNYGGATRGGTYNPQTGRVSAGGRGYNTNVYTGNTVGYRGAAGYDPHTGIVAGAGAGFAGNRYTGQAVGGRNAFAYNTNTNSGIAAGNNNVYAGTDGSVYRYNRNSGSWSQNTGNGWKSTDRPTGSGNAQSMQSQYQARTQGAERTQNYNSMRSSGNFSGSRSMSPRMGGGGRRR